MGKLSVKLSKYWHSISIPKLLAFTVWNFIHIYNSYYHFLVVQAQNLGFIFNSFPHSTTTIRKATGLSLQNISWISALCLHCSHVVQAKPPPSLTYTFAETNLFNTFLALPWPSLHLAAPEWSLKNVNCSCYSPA